MKVGLITYHSVVNFGAQLQTISTIGWLRRNGHTPLVINWYPTDLEASYQKLAPSSQFDEVIRFSEANMPLSRLCRTEEDVICVIDESNIEILLLGSDALFKYQPEKTRRFFSYRKFCYVVQPPRFSVEGLDGNVFFGSFLSKLKRTIPAFVYAVSSQNCPYHLMNRIERIQMKSAMSNFSFISVRDKWTQAMVADIAGFPDAPIYPDPVFSFTRNVIAHVPSKTEIISRYGLPNTYVLLSFHSYFLKPDYLNTITNELLDRGLTPVSLPMPESEMELEKTITIHLPLNPIDWYALIAHSSGYIGERMHPVVCAMQNCKPFYCYDQYGTKVKKSIFSKEYFDISASKTYLIVKEAGMLNNYHSLFDGSPLPSAKTVVDALLSTDPTQANAFMKRQESDYQDAMQQIFKQATEILQI